MAARNKPKNRVAGDALADEVLLADMERKIAARAQAQTNQQQRRTAPRKTMHAIENESVHIDNDSARQVDARTEIDRDSELPKTWRQPNRLDAPPPRPGMVNFWGRFRADNAEDAEHFDEMIEEGWRPVKRASVRKVHELTATTHGKYSGYYVKRGLILLELPENLALQRRRFYHKQLQDQNRGVDRNMFKLQNRVMPLLQPERRTQVTQRARRGSLEAAIPGDEQVAE